jgi:hypothetical protein
MDPYEWFKMRFPVAEGYSVVAIIDADGHFATCPVSKELLDDEPMEGAVVYSFRELLAKRRESRAQG